LGSEGATIRDGWATAPQNVIIEDRPHDVTVWEAYI
jgi:hypothetical protein